MEFRIADTFTDSLSRLTAEEQKATKTTAFDLQVNPTGTGHAFHKIEKSKDKNFWSVKVNSDIRLIVHKTQSSFLLCYVDHHDKAYNWAERRKLETHPSTGAAQLVEIRETVSEIIVPIYKPSEVELPLKPLLFKNISEEELLSYGVPSEWLADVKNLDEDSLLLLADRLPAEAAEALLELATGGKPRIQQPTGRMTSPFEHPDAQRRFRIMNNLEELRTALDYPWEKWTIFLHPEQRQWVDRSYSGPARVSGSAGTGKTIVALHRAVTLAKSHSDARVLLTTYSDTLANALHIKLKRLIGNEPRLAERIDVYSIGAIGKRLANMFKIQSNFVTTDSLEECLKEASNEISNHKFTVQFLKAEWEQVVDAWQLKDWESYRDVVRLGRRTRLPEPQRKILWEIFSFVRSRLVTEKLTTQSEMFAALAEKIKIDTRPAFNFAVIDECQDLNISHIKFLAALGDGRSDSLFFAGDLGQRIFQQPFSWKALGVDIRGRSRTLRINYRTSHQIRRHSDKLLGPIASDIDGNVEDRTDTISVFNGPDPIISRCDSREKEIEIVTNWISKQIKEGIQPHEVGIFVRTEKELGRVKTAVESAKVHYKLLDDQVDTSSGFVSIGTMHLAKGLEFRCVVVMACDDEILPLRERIESIGDEAELQEVYDTERHLLYVACTRARDNLLITGINPVSEFLDDFEN
jgi:hypothetical protein